MTMSESVTGAVASDGRRVRLLMENADGRRVIATRTSWLDMKVLVDGTCIPMVGQPLRFPLSDRNHSGIFLLRTANGLFLTAYPVGHEPGRTGGAAISIASRVFQPELFRAYPIPQGFACREATFVVIPDDYPEAAEPSMEPSRVTPDPKGVLDPWGAICDALLRNFRANRVFPQRPETSSNEYPDDRGSAGRVQPVFSIRCHGHEVALRRLSRTLTWIGSDRNASVPILHPSVSPAQCAVLWDGVTVTVIGTPGMNGMRLAQPSGYGVSGYGVSGYGSPTFTEFQEGRFRPGESLRIGADGEVEIHFPGFTQSEMMGTTPRGTISEGTWSGARSWSDGSSVATRTADVAGVAAAPSVSTPRSSRTSTLASSTLASSTPVLPRTTYTDGGNSEPVGSVNVVLAPLPSRREPDAFRRQRENLERQLEAYRQQQERLWRQQQELERLRAEVTAQRAELAAWRAKLEQERTSQERQRTELSQERLRQATEAQRIQAEQSALMEERRQSQLQREEQERQRQRLVEERTAWLTWRRRYEAQMFRLAAEFAERNAGGAGRMANVTGGTEPVDVASGMETTDPMDVAMRTGTAAGTDPVDVARLGEGGIAMSEVGDRDWETIPTPFLFAPPFAESSLSTRASSRASSVSTSENGGVFTPPTTMRSQPSPTSPQTDYVSRIEPVLRTDSTPHAVVVQTDTEQLSPDFVTPSPWSVRSPGSRSE